MKYKLYFSPGACSLASHIALEEVRADYTLEKVDLHTHQTAKGSYYEINPNGSVPTLDLLDSGDRLTQNVAILTYIADQFAGASLLPPTGTVKRAHAMEMLGFINSDVHHLFHPYFNPKASLEEKGEAERALSAKFAIIDEALRRHAYIAGASCTVVDFYLFVMCRWLVAFKHPAGHLSSVQRHLGLMRERPAVQAALKAEGLGAH